MTSGRRDCRRTPVRTVHVLILKPILANRPRHGCCDESVASPPPRHNECYYYDRRRPRPRPVPSPSRPSPSLQPPPGRPGWGRFFLPVSSSPSASCHRRAVVSTFVFVCRRRGCALFGPPSSPHVGGPRTDPLRVRSALIVGLFTWPVFCPLLQRCGDA
jgi:hypothetical protein